MYREIKPSPRFAPFVKCFWFMERNYSAQDNKETIWPDGNVEVLFHYGNRYKLDGAEGHNRVSHSFTTGPLTRYHELHNEGLMSLIGIRFLPWGFMPFFPMSMHHLVDKIIPLYDLLGEQAKELEDRLHEGSIEHKVAVLEQFLEARLNKTIVEPNPIVMSLAGVMMSKPEMELSLPDWEQWSSLSARQLERKFREGIGVGPKKLNVISRFDAARRTLLFDRSADIMDVAFRYGYYDYSHFAKDFKKFLGCTPKEFKSSLNQNWDDQDVVFLQDEDPELMVK